MKSLFCDILCGGNYFLKTARIGLMAGVEISIANKCLTEPVARFVRVDHSSHFNYEVRLNMKKRVTLITVLLTFIIMVSYAFAGSGTATIIAADQGKTGPASLTAPAAKLVSITITPAKPSVTKGTTLQFIATGKFSDNTTTDLTSSAIWKSSNAKVAAINSSGLATAGAKGGATTITASFEGKRGSTKLTVTVPKLVSITLTPATPSVSKGMTLQFVATGKFSDNTTTDLTSSSTWKSSNAKVAAINPAGLASAVARKGTTTITASFEGKRGSTKLTVAPRALVSITVTPDATSIAKGMTQQFIATGKFSDSTTKDLTSPAKWESSNTEVAAINPAGLATAVAKKGTTTITASFGGKRGSIILTIAPALVSITVTPANMAIRQMTSQKFTATGTYEDSSTQDLTSAATWISETPSVAPINAAGLATGIGVGSSTISATYGSKSGSVNLMVLAREVSCPKTGQATGEGFFKWPAPRFTNSDGTTPVAGSMVVDQLTGLMWTTDANTPGPAACVPGVTKTWQAALDHVACLNTNSYLGYSDWRLPNSKELFSLADYVQSVPATWVYTQGFINVQAFYCYDYWLSTAHAIDADTVSFADMGYGVVYNCNRALSFYVWPVRAGK
jgi:hypothetical protein